MGDAPTSDELRKAEDALDILWGELTVPQTWQLAEEMPRLVEYLAHVHHRVSHEEAMVRRNFWEEVDG